MCLWVKEHIIQKVSFVAWFFDRDGMRAVLVSPHVRRLPIFVLLTLCICIDVGLNANFVRALVALDRVPLLHQRDNGTLTTRACAAHLLRELHIPDDPNYSTVFSL